MMGILIALPIAAAIAILDKRKIEEFLFLAIGIIVSLIFIAGYFDNTLYGVYVGVILGVCAAAYCFVVLIKDIKRFRESVITPGLVWGIALIAAEGAVLIGKTDLGADNDTFWAHAPQILNMYKYSDIGNVGRRMITYSLQYTAPVYTSWCYFCNRLWFDYSDGINLWARQIFILSGLLPFFSYARKGEYKKQILIAILILILPNIVVPSYDLMSDLPIGAASVYGTLMTVRLFRDKEKYNDWGYLLAACLTLFYVCIMKRAGGMYIYGMVSVAVLYIFDRFFDKESKVGVIKKVFPLALMIEAVLLSVLFSFSRLVVITYYFGYTSDEWVKGYIRQYLEPLIVPLGGLILFLLLGIFCQLLKVLFCRKHYMVIVVLLFSVYSIGIYMVYRIAMYLVESQDRDVETARSVFYKFFSMWINREYFGGERFGNGWVISDGLYILILLVVLVLTGVLILKGKLTYKGTVNDISNVIVPVFMGYTLYMMFYCFLYMYEQGGYLVGDSLGYMGRYLGPAVLLVTAIVINELLCIQNTDHTKWLLCAAIFLMLLLPDNVFRIICLDNKDYWGAYEKMYADAGIELSEVDNVIFVGPDHAQYYLFPANCHQDYSVAKGEKAPEDWAWEFYSSGYNYLVLEDYSRDFPGTYQDMFEGGIDSIKKMAIYDVVIEDGTVRFVLK